MNGARRSSTSRRRTPSTLASPPGHRGKRERLAVDHLVPDTYGPEHVDLRSRIDWGYLHSGLGLPCCNYTGLGGGTEHQFNAKNGFSENVQVLICWTDIQNGNLDNCQWGS